MDYSREDWEKNTIIKDSVHGYIKVPKPIVHEIVDTEIFQRLKNIEQTGMQVLYPSATHNRFMHSLGVYHLSKKAFRHFMENVKADNEDIYRNVTNSGKDLKFADEVWKRWGLLFQLASLLHDCGHSPFSHTLEFVYDLPQTPKTLTQKLFDKCSPEFKEDCMKQNSDGKVGKPHERMSALFLATKGKEYGFRDTIKELIVSYLKAYDMGEKYSTDDVFNDDVEFMVRMIIGCLYDVGRVNSYKALEFNAKGWKIELQLRNCIIGMLNSKLDVDNLDYVVRDSKFSGYSSNNIDLERLLASFTIVEAYEFTEENKLKLDQNEYFDYSVNLVSFNGDYINAKISGICAISSDDGNIHAEGNIITDTEDLSPAADRTVYRTKQTFSAKIQKKCGNVSIKPKKQDENAKAYININGYIKGEFQGVILGKISKDGCKGIENGEKRVFFAYNQNCMSVLMSAVEGSNFENKWIYAHHTTTFNNNFLTVYMLERYTGYLLECEVNDFVNETEKLITNISFSTPVEDIKEAYDNASEQIKFFIGIDFDGYEDIYKNTVAKLSHGEVPGSVAKGLCNIVKLRYLLEQVMAIVKSPDDKLQNNPLLETINSLKKRLEEILTQYADNNTFCKVSDAKKLERLYENYEDIKNTEMQLFSKVMAIYEPVEVQGRHFYRSSDQDLLAEYKQLYHKLSKENKTIPDRYQEFMISYRQLVARRSMKCLWKTFQEWEFYFSDWTENDIKKLKKILHRSHTPWGAEIGEKQANYSVLSDYVALSQGSDDLWKELKRKFNVDRIVYVEQAIRTKSFKPYETYMKNYDRVVRLEDIKLPTQGQIGGEFFYIYYDINDKDNKKQKMTPYGFMDTVRELIHRNEEVLPDMSGEKVIMDKKGNIIIRDNVHGDIEFPPLFKKLIDTKEFQRLRRIKQLATASLVFPGAVHTRFSHSIGTYYVMGRILKHFKDYFRSLNYETEFDEIDEKAILAAALLHDLGHGPYSHTFEKAKLSTGKKKHEQWTVDIIKNENSEVNQVLKLEGENFPDMVIEYIQDANKLKKEESDVDIKHLDNKLNLKFIFASLVSGQIDADRMDYLLRDAMFSGVTCGQFDMEKIIQGMAVTVENTGRYRLGILEDYVSAVEEYFYARYQMYNNIYYYPYKLFSEEILRRILVEAQQAYIDGSIPANTVPPALEDVFNQAEITVEQYCQLDDSVVDGAARTWLYSSVKSLAYLCKSHLERGGYQYLEIIDLAEFDDAVLRFFGNDVWNKHFLIKCNQIKVALYDDKKPVYILKHSGISEKIQDYSKLKVDSSDHNYVYYSRECAELVYGVKQDVLEKFDAFLETNKTCNNMEIEKKYILKENMIDVVSEKIKDIALELKYSIEDVGEKNQKDIYYDTCSFELDKIGYALRIRNINEEYFITCKSPVSSVSSGINGQLERREKEEKVEAGTVADNKDLIIKMLGKLPDAQYIYDRLEEKIEIQNQRHKYIINKNNDADNAFSEKYELVVDNVKYINLKNQKIYKEYQIELELKSSYQSRINMKYLTDALETAIHELEAIDESKYKRALKFTE